MTTKFQHHAQPVDFARHVRLIHLLPVKQAARLQPPGLAATPQPIKNPATWEIEGRGCWPISRLPIPRPPVSEVWFSAFLFSQAWFYPFGRPPQIGAYPRLNGLTTVKLLKLLDYIANIRPFGLMTELDVVVRRYALTQFE